MGPCQVASGLTYSLKKAKASPVDHEGSTRLERAELSAPGQSVLFSAPSCGHWIDETSSEQLSTRECARINPNWLTAKTLTSKHMIDSGVQLPAKEQ